jgi:WD40 repeat protein
LRLGLLAEPGNAAREKPGERFDLYGDPLPPGAVARVGTVRYSTGPCCTQVVFSRDGKMMIATSPFGSIPLRFWEVETGRVQRSLPGLADRNGRVCVAAVSPDGERLAAGDNQGLVRVGRVHTGGQLYELAVPHGPIRSLMYSGDGSVLAAGDDATTVWYWEAGTGRKLRRLDVGVSTRIVALGRDGKTLAVGRGDGTVAIVDLATGREVRGLPGAPRARQLRRLRAGRPEARLRGG